MKTPDEAKELEMAAIWGLLALLTAWAEEHDRAATSTSEEA